MYESYFGLTGNPFGMTPDPQCYFQSESHKEAYAGLTYGIAERRGLMTLVGEVGTGKTTLLNAIIDSLERSTVIILVRHTTVDREELLRIILHNLYASQGPRQTKTRRRQVGSTLTDSRIEGLISSIRDRHTTVDREELLRIILHNLYASQGPRQTKTRRCQVGSTLTDSRIAGLSRIELINEFYAFVSGEFMADQPPPLLIIDEAQNLSVDVLEEVRLLTNLEDPKSKMLQVILAGQPELEDKLMRTDLRQLRQRIAVSARLGPLSPADTGAYIAFRLEHAGCNAPDLFRKAAVDAIWAASNGSPRTINVLCDHCLVNAFATGMGEVEGRCAREAIHDVLCLQLKDTLIRKPGPYLVAYLESQGESSDEKAAAVDEEERGDRVG